MSGTASLEVVDGDPTPPYEQLRRQLVALIETGTLVRTARLLGAGADEVRAAVDRALSAAGEAR